MGPMVVGLGRTSGVAPGSKPIQHIATEDGVDEQSPIAGVQRAIWEAFPSAIVVHHESGRVLYANARAYGMTHREQDRTGAQWSLLSRGCQLIRPDRGATKRLAPLVRHSGRALLNVPMGLRYPDGEVLWQVASCFPIVDVRGVRYQVTSVVESPELGLLEEVAGWLRQDLVQSMLGVAFSLQAQLTESSEIEIGDRVRWAVGVLHESASRALGLADLAAPRLRHRLDENAKVQP